MSYFEYFDRILIVHFDLTQTSLICIFVLCKKLNSARVAISSVLKSQMFYNHYVTIKY